MTFSTMVILWARAQSIILAPPFSFHDRPENRAHFSGDHGFFCARSLRKTGARFSGSCARSLAETVRSNVQRTPQILPEESRLCASMRFCFEIIYDGDYERGCVLLFPR